MLTRLPPGRWRADAAHSYAGFAVRHMGVATFRGHFEALTATLEVADDGAAALTGEVLARSLRVVDPAMARSLRSPAFLDAEAHPVLAFRSLALQRWDDHVEVDGVMTVKGRTLRVVASGRVAGARIDPAGGRRLGLALATVLDRRQFGLGFDAAMPDATPVVDHEVRVEVQLELVREAAGMPSWAPPCDASSSSSRS